MRLRSVLLGLVCFALAGSPARAQAPAVLGDFDARGADRADVRGAVDAARDRLAAKLGDEGALTVDRRSGAVASLSSVDTALTGAREGDAAEVALDYVRDHRDAFGLDGTDFAGLRLAARYRDVNGITHLTWQQTSDGLVSYDTTLSVNLGPGNEVLNVVGSPVHGLDAPTTEPRVSALAALAVAKAEVGGELRPPAASRGPGVARPTLFANGDNAELVVVADEAGDRLAWRIEAAGQDPVVYEVVVDAAGGDVLARHSLTDFADQALVYDNHPGTSAPFTPHTVNLNGPDGTWLNNSSGRTRLQGANAHAYADEDESDSATAAEEIAAVGGDWYFPQQSVACAAGQIASSFSGRCTWDGTSGSTATIATNRAQGTTQLFYLVNNYHDWLEAAPIGFTPASHNFEVGGPGGDDFVQAESQDSAGLAAPDYNNANFSTPADGASPRMQMYLYRSAASPANRPAVSSADDGSVVYHEYTHGLSNRLVNNGLGSGLVSKQSRAMGEGWSDFYASDYLVEKGFEPDTAADGEVLHADYTNNDTVGVGRTEAVDCSVGSSNATRCPGTPGAGAGGYTAGDVGRVDSYVTGTVNPAYPYFEVHADGEVWAQTLWDLRKAIGAAATRRLVAEAMRLSPVPPSMVDERDAILLADAAAGGAFHDQIWSVFAARGFGVGAFTTNPSATRITESFAAPAGVAAAGRPAVTDPAPLGDGDGAAEPGETVRVSVPLRNLTPSALTVGAARLSTAQAGVVVGTPTVNYGSIGSETTSTPAATFSVTLPSGAACAAAVPLDLKVTDATTLALSLPVGRRVPGTTYAAGDLPKTILDNTRANSITSTLTVPGPARTVDDVRVHVTITHPNIGDLDGRLIAPDGTTVELFERPGRSGDGSTADDMDVDFDDSAADSVQDRTNVQLLTGSLRPDERLSRVAGRPLNGDWKLRVYDAATGNTGTLTGFTVTPLDPVCATTAAALPTAASAAATAVTQTGATINGNVNPNGTATQYAFQYGPTADYGAQTAPADAGAGSSAAAISATLSALTQGATYHYRAVALRSGTVVAAGADLTFTADAPTVLTGPASAVSATGATLTGSIDAKGVPTNYAFQYGPSTSYGTQTPASSAGSASGPVSRSSVISELAESTLYHFRLVALRGGGTVVAVGGDQTFTTLAAQATATANALPTATATVVPPSVAGLSPTLKLDKRRKGTLTFRALPLGAAGNLAIKARKAGRKKAFAVTAARFTVPATGRVSVPVVASKKAYRALGKRPRKKAAAAVTLHLGGATFTLPIVVRR